jgi:hypothetical protein
MDEKQPPRKRRWLQGLLITLAGVLIALIGMFLTRNLWITRLVERYAEAAGMQVTVKGLALGRALTVEELVVTDPALPDRPLARIAGLRIAPTILSGYTLAIEEVTAKRADIDWHKVEAVAAVPQGGGDGRSGGDDRGGGGRRGKRGNMDDYLPYTLKVDELHLASTTTEGSFRAGPLKVEARLRPSKTASLRITGSPAIHAEGPGVPQPIDVTGPISIVAERSGDGVTADITASQPGVLEMDTHVKATFGGRNANIDAEFRKGVMAGPLWPALLTALAGVPVSFERIESAPGATINIALSGGLPEFKSASAALSVTQLRVGPEAAPWVDSSVEIGFVPPVDGALVALSLKAGPDVAVDAVMTGFLPPKFDVTLKNVSTAALAKAFPAVAPVRAALPALREISGKAMVLLPVFTLDATLTGRLEGVDAGLNANVKYGGGKLSATAKLGEGTQAEMKPFVFDSGVATYTMKADLAEAGGLLGLAGWGGTVEAQGEITPGDPALPGKIEMKLLNIVSDSFSLPYEVPMTVTARHTRDAKSGEFKLSDIAAALEGQAEVSAATLSAAWPKASAGGLKIALQPAFLASQGLLESGAGTISLSGDAVALSLDGLGAPLAFTIDATELVLPEKAAALRMVSGSGTLGWSGGMQATGNLAVGQFLCAGAVLENATGTLRAEGTAVIIDDIKGTLFGGAVAGTLRAEPFAEGLPMRLEARLEGGDLALFTAQVQPPGVNVTGSVAGDVLVGIRGEDFTELVIDLGAPAGVTINKALVQQMLMSQDMAGMTGSKTVGKVLEKIVGGDEQRPFDSAELKLGLADGRIAGTAFLKSKALNLNVDIKADPGAVWEAIQSRGQVSFGDVTTQ